MISRVQKGGVLLALALVAGGVFASFGSSQALAKDGADNVVGAVPVYSVGITSADIVGSTLTLGGRATISNFKGKEAVQFVKFAWGDGKTEIVTALSLPTYYKSSGSISILAWTKSHVYATNGSYTVTVTVYRGSATGAEAYPLERASITLQTENSIARCTDGLDNDRDGKKDFVDADCAPYKVPETTLELCSDGRDNDGNGLKDLYDPSCVAFVPAENTLETCSDGIDNNYNGKVDLADDSCDAFRPDENTLELCRDTVDNDYDGKTDGYDSDCWPYNVPENTEETCGDGIDNDYNGIRDRQEGACTPFFNVGWGSLIFF